MYAKTQNTWPGEVVQARRVGIAPPASCADGLDKEIAKIVTAHGCRTLLRATYTDVTGLRAATVGIAVFPDMAAADAAESDLHRSGDGRLADRRGLLMARFPGTVVDRFDDAQRQIFQMSTNHTSYMFFRSEGPMIAQAGVPAKRTVRVQIAEDLLGKIMTVLADDGEPCKRKAVRC
ncbi:hypothetical protein [Actinomadura rupiterrae]|uniref:hypothetical protein n=1 Tax=Actinomadura rupiterrae TaxID=559627 RepID=UPI0020A315F3|nr:hypothetical protein [Actinomadura rupiterrae]MCP2336473.1 hypothetical protein [Actinomadura rupiterrae]